MVKPPVNSVSVVIIIFGLFLWARFGMRFPVAPPSFESFIGVDGTLDTILKEAAAAVDTRTLDASIPVVDSLLLLFNFVFKHEVWPKRWGQGIIFPLFKEGSRLDPGNYRPIALLSVVDNRLSDWSEQTVALADERGGFRRHGGTPELIFMLRETILTRKALGQPTLTTFIDARKAYDSVWREGNYVRLHDLGVRGKLWRQLQVMNATSESKIRLPFGETEWFKVTRGVAQGAVESPSYIVASLMVWLKT